MINCLLLSSLCSSLFVPPIPSPYCLPYPNSAVVGATIYATVANCSSIVSNIGSGVTSGYPVSTKNVFKCVTVEFLIHFQVVDCDSSHDDLLWMIVGWNVLFV